MPPQAQCNELTLDEVAEILDAPPVFVAQLVARDAIPYERPRKGSKKYRADELRFRRDAIQQWLNQDDKI